MKGNFFFFVGCFCAIIGASKDHCIIITYFIFLVKLAELVGVYFGFLWLCYVSHFLGALINYTNIITAIDYYSKNKSLT